MNRVGIIGTGQTKHARKRNDVSQSELVNEAVVRALADAEMTSSDIDAVVIANMELFEGRALPELWVGEGALAWGKPCLKIATGGTSGTSGCIAGFHQVGSGLFDTVLVVGFAVLTSSEFLGLAYLGLLLGLGIFAALIADLLLLPLALKRWVRPTQDA